MYNKTDWVNGTTPLSADNLDKIEEGIYQNSSQLADKANAVQPALITPTFSNGWAQRSGYQKVGYFKDTLGFVHIQGTINGTTWNTVAFTLPVGYRPLPSDGSFGYNADFATESGQGMGMININSSGSVVPVSGATLADVSLNISPFLARE